jgi:hypothetical protein
MKVGGEGTIAAKRRKRRKEINWDGAAKTSRCSTFKPGGTGGQSKANQRQSILGLTSVCFL